jgi:hypothetical protein
MIVPTGPRRPVHAAVVLAGSPRAVCVLCILVAFAVSARAADTGRVLVRSKPSGAEVFFADEEKPRGKTPWIVMNIPPGTHMVRASLDGYADVSEEVEVEEGAMARVSFTLTAEPEAEGETETAPEAKRAGDAETGARKTDEAPWPDDEADASTDAGDAWSDEDEIPRHIHVRCPVCSGSGLWEKMGCPSCTRTGRKGVFVCENCRGTRRVDFRCPFCAGTGKEKRAGKEGDCRKCMGKGKLPCPMCRGKGKLKRKNPEYSADFTMTCPYCRGEGFENNVKCQKCGGTGRGPGIAGYSGSTGCSFCGADGKGPPLCGRCGGTGLLGTKKRPAPCQPCFATGRLFRPCRACRGQGWVRER